MPTNPPAIPALAAVLHIYLIALIALIALSPTLTAAHHRNEEYTYLSMFLKPPDGRPLAPGARYLTAYSSGSWLARHPATTPDSSPDPLVRPVSSDSHSLPMVQPDGWADNDDDYENVEQQETADDSAHATSHPALLPRAFGATTPLESANSDKSTFQPHVMQPSHTSTPRAKLGTVSSGDAKDAIESTHSSPAFSQTPVRVKHTRRKLKDATKTVSLHNNNVAPKKSRSRRQLKASQFAPSREESSLAEELKPISVESKVIGENIQKLSIMLMKLMKQYKVKSIVDVPCRAHSHWMPIFLKHFSKRRKGKLQYFCVDTNREILRKIKEGVDEESVTAKYILQKFWVHPLPKADLVFSWNGLDNMREQNVVKFIQNLGRSGKRHELVMIGSHSGSLKQTGSAESISKYTLGGRPVNLRMKPFGLRRPMRIVGDVSQGRNDKQLYIYKPADMLQEGMTK